MCQVEEAEGDMALARARWPWAGGLVWLLKQGREERD
jgi:hypothetical protein